MTLSLLAIGIISGASAAPEDEKILFVSTRDGNSEIYIMDVDGNNQIRLTNHPAFDTSPFWSPDGTKILFSSARDNGGLGNPAVGAEIFVMDADGKKPRDLSKLEEGFNGDPAWSPDCTKIAFGQSVGFSWELRVMDVSGVVDTERVGDSINLSNRENVDDRGPSWSRDGKKIAFTSNRNGKFQIYVMNADGSNPINISKDPKRAVQPSWSPDGKKIAFCSRRDGDDEIYVMDKNGDNQIRLTENPADDISPSWSSDGTKIAFASDRDGNFEIYVMDADGNNQTRLTKKSYV